MRINIIPVLFIMLISFPVFGLPNIQKLKANYEFADSVIILLGGIVADSLDSKNSVLPESSPYTKRIRNLSKKHLNEDGLKIDIKVYQKKDINAFSLPNGSVRFFSGLMDVLDDEELKFILGHEIGHIKKRHSLNKMVVTFGLDYINKMVKNDELLGAIPLDEVANKSVKYMNSKFSQWEEFQADKYGFAFMKLHKYSLSAPVSAFEDLAKLEKKPSLYATHPPSQKRKLLMLKLKLRAE